VLFQDIARFTKRAKTAVKVDEVGIGGKSDKEDKKLDEDRERKKIKPQKIVI